MWNFFKKLRELDAYVKVAVKEGDENAENVVKRLLKLEKSDWKLPSINKGDVQYVKKMNEGVRKRYVADASLVFENPAFQKEQNALIDTQVYFMAEESSQDEVSLSFGRGTINGIRLMYERFESMAMEHKSNIEPKKEPDPTDYHSFIEDDL